LKAFGQLAESPNQKVLMLPIEAVNVLGSLAGIGEIARETFGLDGKGGSPATRRPTGPAAGQSVSEEGGMVEWIVALGTWNWFILAAVLLLLEVLAPGMFMLWLGLSAILVGIISTVVIWSWQSQLIAFAVFAVASVPAWRHFARKVETPGDSPFL